MHLKRTLAITTLLLTTLLMAQTASAQGTLIDEEKPDRWRSSLFVYLWALSMDGTAGIGGNEVDIDASFSDLLDVLDAAFSVRFESHKGGWGYFLDGMYTKLKPEQDTQLGRITLETKSFVGEAGGVYHFNPTVHGLFGLRYQSMDTELRLPNRTVGDKPDWLDAFVGIRLVPVRTEKWNVWLRGDVGGGDSDTMWNGVIGAGYRFNKRWSLVGAYRVLSNNVEQDGFKWDVDYEGLGIALGYTFQ